MINFQFSIFNYLLSSVLLAVVAVFSQGDGEFFQKINLLFFVVTYILLCNIKNVIVHERCYG